MSCGCAASLFLGSAVCVGADVDPHLRRRILRHGDRVTPGGRLAAAIEILADIETRHRPASGRAEGLGPVAPLRRLEGPRRRRRADLRHAAPARLGRLDHGGRHAARPPDRRAARCPRDGSRTPSPRCSPARRTHRRCSARASARRCRPVRSPTRRRPCRAIFRTGSKASLDSRARRRAGARDAGDGRARAARPAPSTR